MLRLIITADDFGYNEERDKGMVECLMEDDVTRVSLMVNTVSCNKEYLKKYLPTLEGRVGLHFNITEGWPLSKDVKSLTDDGGMFRGKEEMLEKCGGGVVDFEDIQKELEAQIERFKYLVGCVPFYVDGHQHSHVFPVVREAFAHTLTQHHIRETRLPFEEGYLKSPFLRDVVSEAKQAKNLFAAHNISHSNVFMGMGLMGREMSVDVIKQHFDVIKKNGDVCVELMCHPGYPCLQPEKGGCGGKADDFSHSEDRLHELKVITSNELKQYFESHNFKKVSSCFL